MMRKKSWRGGMVGAGAWSETQLAAWARVKNARIIALCDRHADRRRRVVSRFGIPHEFDDCQEMLSEMNLDFIDICTRPYSHSVLARQVAEKGLPVLCQKPFCSSLSEARQLVEFCKLKNVPLMINENYRWQAWFRTAKGLLHDGAVGRPFFCKIERRVRFTLPQFEHRQAYFSGMSQLIVLEMGIHFLDTLRFLFGQPQLVYARTHRVSPHVSGEDVALIMLVYDEMTCLVILSWASVQVPGLDCPDDDQKGVPRFEIDGTEGTLALDCAGRMTLHTDSHHQTWKFDGDVPLASRVDAQRHFIDCLESGRGFETNGADYVKSMALVYAAYSSAEQGRPVTLTTTTQTNVEIV